MQTMLTGAISRRELLSWSGLGLGGLALHVLGDPSANAAATSLGNRFDLRPKSPPAPARAKAVILMMQNGGPSQMDLFDPKPELKKHNAKQHSIKVEMFQTGSEQNQLLDTPFAFHRRGAAGLEMSEVLPHIG